MGWDGAGNYSRQHNFSADASAGIKILALRVDQELDDVASAMTIALTRNGQNVPTGNLPMGGFRHINVGAPVSVNNYMRSREFIENIPVFMDDTASSADRISVSAQYFTSVSANQAPGDGTRILVRVLSDKSSAALFLNGHSANVEFQDGNRAGEAMVSGGIYEMLFSSADAAWKITKPDDGRTAIERSVGVTIADHRKEPGNVLRYGHNTTPGTTDMAAAFQAAIDVAAAQGASVRVPAGTYLIGSSIEITGAISGVKILGDGASSTRLINGIVGAGSDPLLLINTNGNFHVVQGLMFDGNNLDGVNGNGHAISLINPGVTLAPNNVCIRDCVIQQHRGTGKDDGGASIDACGIYAFDNTGFSIENCYITQCQMGVRLNTMEDASFRHVTIDACDLNAVYFEDCHSVHLYSAVLQQCGEGGTDDGCVHIRGCSNINFLGGEWKNGNPYCFNAAGTNVISDGVLIRAVEIAQLDDTMGHTCIGVNNATQNLAIENCPLGFVSTITDGKGVEVVQAAAGYSTTGFRLIGCSFSVGSGGTISACLHLNVGTNRVCGALIESNMFGFQSSVGSATTITDAILLEGKVEGIRLQSNTFMTATNVTITDCVHIGSTDVVGLKMDGNEYQGFGTITNHVNNAAGIQYERRDRVADGTYLPLIDGVSALALQSGHALIFVDTADGDLKVRYSDGTLKTIVVDT